ncbi:ribosome maturation factor RimP [Actinomyces israelii]|uniref:Ribosome maturation factor RimP n=1 Tax=Actinomyces israelii TaxID=1659 RepID=A0ABT4IBI5_9ACTO|nr:ribosome maturation factor RimP [Actinomyces israelii]MCZ0859106.1 ribosome maturation factor RimP [Actinomyces israelii]WKR22150.1 Ribosome maturation factor RimP [Actinomyces israelii]
MADALARSLTELLTPVVEDAGAFLEGVETTRAGRYSTVRVLVDLPDGPGDLDLDALTTVSRAVSAAVDEADPVRGQYTLEVSTPGAERELSTPRHFRRAVGRDVELMVKDDGVDAVLTGTVTAADEDSVTLQADGRERVLALDDVRQARMVVIF